MRLERDAELQGQELLVLGVDPNGFAGRLAPGSRHQIAVLFESTPAYDCEHLDFADFEVSLLADGAAAIPWDTLESPGGILDWPAVKASLSEGLTDWEDYQEHLAALATRLARRGVDVASVRRLFRLAVREVLGKPTAAAVGRVVDEGTRRPVAKASVVAFEGEDPVSTAATDPDGAFALDWLENAHSYRVEVKDHAGTLDFTMPAEGDRFRLELAVTPEARDADVACGNCDEAGLPDAPLAPPAPLFTTVADWRTQIVCSVDPNEKYGPRGARPRRFVPQPHQGGFIGPATKHTYKIHFQNIGGAPAQRVVTRDRLVPEFELASVEFLEMQWGDYHVGLTMQSYDIHSGYQRLSSLDPRRLAAGEEIDHWLEPATRLRVEIDTAVDAYSREVEWVFQTLARDETGRWVPVDSESFDDGFLPPPRDHPDDPPDRKRASGYVSFRVRTAARNNEDRPVKNHARITFDTDNPVETLYGWTNYFSLFGPAEPPVEPTPPDGELDVPLDVTLRWTTEPAPPVHAYSYEVYLWEGEGERPEDLEPVASLPAGEPRFEPVGLVRER